MNVINSCLQYKRSKLNWKRDYKINLKLVYYQVRRYDLQNQEVLVYMYTIVEK